MFSLTKLGAFMSCFRLKQVYSPLTAVNYTPSDSKEAQGLTVRRMRSGVSPVCVVVRDQKLRRGQRSASRRRPVWSRSLKARRRRMRSSSSSSLKSGAGGVREGYSRLTDIHSALNTISTLCVM